jgi:EAL domain-containing protein (putative c-di-GMP-specific phosphodiesterase class I)
MDRQRLLAAQLPLRLERLQQRGARLAHAWDINLLQRLAEDAALLAALCREVDAGVLAGALDALHATVATLLRPAHLPDAATAARIAHQLAAVQAAPLPTAVTDRAQAAGVVVAGPTHEAGTPLFMTPPPAYWERLAAYLAAARPTHAAEVAAEPAAADAALTDTAWTERLRGALDGRGFELLFQPIMPLHGAEEAQFQALLRLHDDDGRVYAAAEVIPAAERTGLIGAVDRWVLLRSIAVIGERAQREASPRLFVRQSLASLRDAGLADWLQAQLAHHGVAAAALSLELGADEIAPAFDEVERHARTLHALGIGFTLAGYTGDANCERALERLPLDFVKPAPHWLRIDDENAREVLRALVERLHAGGRRVIAPRIEDARAAAALWNTGVDFIQGNFVQAADRGLAFDFGEAVV